MQAVGHNFKNHIIETIYKTPTWVLGNKEVVLKFLKTIESQLKVFERFIEINGSVKAVEKDFKNITDDDLMHDFCLFGLTKCYKTFNASKLLSEYFFREDSLILLRSAYEIYLSLNYVFHHPHDLDHFMRKSLGVSANLFTHPISKKGRPIKSKILDEETGQIEDYGLGISKLLGAINSENELRVHSFIFPYLSEHVHLNMISSGNYRDNAEAHYTSKGMGGYHQGIVYLAYLTILVFDFLLSDFEVKQKGLKKRMNDSNIKMKNVLENYVRNYFVAPENQNPELKNWFLNRINEEKKIK